MLDAADSLAPVDHTHTNAEVNTSIATNPAASATAMGLGTGNTPTLAGLNTTGNVGIGATSPTEKLEIYNSSEGVYLKAGAGDGGVRSLKFSSYNNGSAGAGHVINASSINGEIRLQTSGSDRLTVNKDGNVGIGTTAPSSKLEVAAGATANVDIAHFSNSNGIVKIKHSLAVDGSGEISVLDGYNTEDIRLSAQGNSWFNAGNVGIGTTGPSAKLDILAVDLAKQLRVSNTSADSTTKYGAIMGSHYSNSEENVTGMLITSSSSIYGGVVSIGGGIGAANAANNVVFYTAENNTTLGGSERMRVTALGNVGIGTTSPSELLDVSSNTGAAGGTANPTTIRISDTSYGSAWDTVNSFANLDFHSADTSGSGAGVKARVGAIAENTTGASIGLAFSTTYSTYGLLEKMRIDNNGNVGIGTASPNEKLDVVGNIKASGTVRTGSMTVSVATGSSSATAVAAGEGAMTYISNESGGATIAFSDGIVWRRVSDRAPIS